MQKEGKPESTDSGGKIIRPLPQETERATEHELRENLDEALEKLRNVKKKYDLPKDQEQKE